MKTLLITLLCLLNVSIWSQSYECKDQANTTFNIVITDNAYNLVIDDYIIITQLDTIIIDSICTKYVPLNHFRDTLTVFKDTYVSLSGSGLKTTFSIVRELEDWEEQILFNKPLIKLNID